MKLVAIISLASMLLMQAGGAVANDGHEIVRGFPDPSTPDDACTMLPMYMQLGIGPEQLRTIVKLCSEHDDVSICHDTLKIIRQYADGMNTRLMLIISNARAIERRG